VSISQETLTCALNIIEGCRVQLKHLINRKRAATLVAPIATTLFMLPVLAGDRLNDALDEVRLLNTEEQTELVTGMTTEEINNTVTVQRWVGINFTETETKVLNFLQDRGITDRAALATILGNIRQESLFKTRICEGGAMTGYHNCRRGGFGLIQWTTLGRYNGLGTFARNYGGDPNELETQLRWMVNEREWLLVDHIWKTPGKSINSYMNAAYRWLGWGIHGNRTHYAQNYYNSLTQVEVEVHADT